MKMMRYLTSSAEVKLLGSSTTVVIERQFSAIWKSKDVFFRKKTHHNNSNHCSELITHLWNISRWDFNSESVWTVFCLIDTTFSLNDLHNHPILVKFLKLLDALNISLKMKSVIVVSFQSRDRDRDTDDDSHSSGSVYSSVWYIH